MLAVVELLTLCLVGLNTYTTVLLSLVHSRVDSVPSNGVMH